MTSETTKSNLPAQIAEAISGVPKALVPSSIKALDRLVGAAVDIPVAWLGQKKAKIDAQTQAYAAVEAAISAVVATEAGATREIVQQAMNVLVRKEYRKQTNRNAVGLAALEDLRAVDPGIAPTDAPTAVDVDWMNIFERYAEDASTERMQQLWGRVLAGEIRKAGSYSMRTLRFLSEFSQADALTFAEFCESAFGFFAPKCLVKPDGEEDIRYLLDLEAAGLIRGITGQGLLTTVNFEDSGKKYIKEGHFSIVFRGKPHNKFNISIIPLTPLGEELLSLIPGRDPRAAAKKLASACKRPEIEEAYLIKDSGDRSNIPIEIFWQAGEEDIDVGSKDSAGL